MEAEMKVALIQMNPQGDKAANLAQAERLITEAVTAERPDLVVLPEYFACNTDSAAGFHASAEEFPHGIAYGMLAGLARGHGIYLHAGSMVERAGNRHYNTTVVFGRDGTEIARYRKIHLFDVDLADGTTFRESDTIDRGGELVTYKADGWLVGCSICYDLRFPELFRALRARGAEIIALPSAFTAQTGKDHWELLARARAVETQTWFLAVGSVGTYAEGRKACWGHSMVVDPWGAVVAQASDQIGFVTARLDKAYLTKVRASIPVERHHVLQQAA
jgi:deaminated glutathione amidase